MHFFITATDTEVGKTYVTALLARHLSQVGKRVAAFKPISCGDRNDAEILAAAVHSGLSLDEINPIHFSMPAAPYRAGELDFADLVKKIQQQEAQFEALVVEGIGGWMVPLTRNETVVDLAKALGYSVLLVAGNRLGVLNHTLLTVAQIEQCGVPFAGVILNQFRAEPDTLGNAGVLRELLGDRFLGETPFGAESMPPEITERLKI